MNYTTIILENKNTLRFKKIQYGLKGVDLVVGLKGVDLVVGA